MSSALYRSQRGGGGGSSKPYKPPDPILGLLAAERAAALAAAARAAAAIRAAAALLEGADLSNPEVAEDILTKLGFSLTPEEKEAENMVNAAITKVREAGHRAEVAATALSDQDKQSAVDQRLEEAGTFFRNGPAVISTATKTARLRAANRTAQERLAEAKTGLAAKLRIMADAQLILTDEQKGLTDGQKGLSVQAIKALIEAKNRLADALKRMAYVQGGPSPEEDGGRYTRSGGGRRRGRRRRRYTRKRKGIRR